MSDPKITYIGHVTARVMLPLLGALQLKLVDELTAKLAGLLALQLKLGIMLPGVKLDIAAKLVAALRASLVITPPGLNVQVNAVALLIVKLRILLALVIQIGDLLAAGGIDMFLYEGLLSEMGTTINSQVPPLAGLSGSEEVFAPVLVVRASLSPTVGALQKLLKLSP